MPIYEEIKTQGVPIKVFTDQLDEKARDQLIQLAESGIAVGHVSAMPDVHWGAGATVGSVFASDTYIAPNAVGVDIGCGMAAVPIIDLEADSISWETKQEIHRRIKKEVPLGTDSHKEPKEAEILDNPNHSKWLEKQISRKTACQIGTLGSGNHFIELVKDSENKTWIFLHSGSRNIGKVTAEHYNQLAKEYLKQSGKTAPNPDLNYLPIDSEDGQNYLQDMSWCQEYALANRQEMLHIVSSIVKDILKKEPDFSRAVNIHHNYCSCEDCTWEEPGSRLVTRKLWVTRKGATSARDGQFGLIPGSMGTGSFLVRGKGNRQSWNSCSHGAGRTKSRIKAKQEIRQEDFVNSMEGIVCDTDPELRDEAPQAYKDIGRVMENQSDLVEIVTRFSPLINVKGFDKIGKWVNQKSPVRIQNLDIYFPRVNAVEIAEFSEQVNKRGKATPNWKPLEEWKIRYNNHSPGRSANFWFLSNDNPSQAIFINCKVISSDEKEVVLELGEVRKKRKV